jgi:hypothetical protein
MQENKEKINISNLNKGVYFVKIITENYSIVKKLTVN